MRADLYYANEIALQGCRNIIQPIVTYDIVSLPTLMYRFRFVRRQTSVWTYTRKRLPGRDIFETRGARRKEKVRKTSDHDARLKLQKEEEEGRRLRGSESASALRGSQQEPRTKNVS